jgi:hypothetical protein
MPQGAAIRLDGGASSSKNPNEHGTLMSQKIDGRSILQDETKAKIVSKNVKKASKNKKILPSCTSSNGDIGDNAYTEANGEVIIAMDCEWQHDPRYPLRNTVLCYSLSVRFGGNSLEIVVETARHDDDGE